MQIHTVKAEKKNNELKREDQLAWKIAKLAAHADEVKLDDDVKAMIQNRIIDNAAIAIAAINEKAVQVARVKALASEGTGKATIYGMPGRNFGVKEAAFFNAVAVRFRDQDDTYLAAEYSHPDDNISPLLAVAQQMDCSGADLMRGIAVAYEVHIALVGTGDETGICLHKHKVDHMTHIAAATAAGIGAMLKPKLKELEIDGRKLNDEEITEIIYHAVNFAVQNSVSSRQSRAGVIGSQKEFVPGFSAEIAIDAFNYAMHGLKGPNPVYEGVDGLIRRFLNGKTDTDEKQAEYRIKLAEPGKDPLRNILMSYPKEHAFEYQGQAIIDLALELREKLPKKANGTPDWSKISGIVLETSHHTHHVIGTDVENPARIDPDSTRGTLDHSIMFAIARAMQLGRWDEDVYNIKPEEKEELRQAMAIIKTAFDQRWEDKYHSTNPEQQGYGGKMIITLTNGDKIEDEKSVANAHPLGSNPWKRPDYEKKLEKLTESIVNPDVRKHLLESVDQLETLSSGRLRELTPKVNIALELSQTRGILDQLVQGRGEQMAR